MPIESQDLDEDKTAPYPRGAQLVKRLFDHLGIPQRMRTGRVEELMEWSYHPAHRRMKGEVPWTVDELERLTMQCGMTLASLLQLEQDDATEPGSFALGAQRIPCRVVVDGISDPEKPGAVVALKEAGKWLVVPAADARGSPSYAVKNVLLLPEPGGPRKRIAVIDDTRDITDSVCRYLRLVGFEAHPFATFESLSEAIKTEPFDAYIIDWLIGKTSAAGLIAEIRTADASCPIAVLTGKVRDGEADPEEVAKTVTEFQASFYEKPAATPIIAAKLKQALDLLKAKRPQRRRAP